MNDTPPPRTPAAASPGLNRPQKIAAAILATAAFFTLVPEWDLALSALFYRADAGFFLRDAAWVQAAYAGTRWLVIGCGAAVLLSLAYASLPRSAWAAQRARLLFLLLSLAIGPGLISNTLLKDHLGRPRPEQLEQFGGAKGVHYVVPLWPSQQCERNCSFPSGHAAAAFWLISGAWAWPLWRRRFFVLGIGAGSLVGLARMAQGGHFLSDVVGALAVVWLSNMAIAALLQRAAARWARRR